MLGTWKFQISRSVWRPASLTEVFQSLPASPAESWDSTRKTDKTAFFQILSNESFSISILLDAIKSYAVEKTSVRNSSINREPDGFWVRRRQTQVLLNEWMLLGFLKIWSDVPVEPITVLFRPFLSNITTPQNSVLKRNVIRKHCENDDVLNNFISFCSHYS